MIFPLLTFLWMAVIFSFSANPAEESTQISRSVGRMIGEICISEFQEWPKERQDVFAERIDYPVRKCAHASEYAILGILLWLSISEIAEKKMGLYAFVTGTIYAASDEFHQLYVPGRSGQISDVILDASGILIGLLLIYTTYRNQKI
ncbi:VanZ family protein [Faecalicatena contorta]|uniref:VanZ family protein n=1 Tax=Faecalicatena contorta TaxID=39482 RepID=UPI001F22A1EC|nr:VanZ family protein [Faecalicatena contorta]